MKIRHGLAAVLLALLTSPVVCAAESWRIVTTEHFRVLSQANERQTQLWVRNYEQFIAITSKATGIKPTSLTPLTMILFARDKEFTPYKLVRPDGKAARVAGQFVRLGGFSAIGLAVDSDLAETRRVIYHEGTHWLMSRDLDRHPTWFTEGIAEMLSTFELNGSKVNWAKPIDSHLAQLQGTGLLPLRDFLARTDALQDQGRDDDRYYAQSWAFVHFLMLSQPSRVQVLDRAMVAYRNNSGEAAIREAFGENLPVIERDFNRYVLQAGFSYVTSPIEATPEPPASTVAPPAVVEAALGFMALTIGKKELAQQHAQRAVELATDLPDGHEVLALLARENKDAAAIRKHADAAVRAGSRSADMYVLLADALYREKTGDFQATAAARIPLLRKAIELDPLGRDGYEQLANDLMYYDKPTAEDLLPLEQGHRWFPKDDWISVGLAVASGRLRGGDEAMQAIAAALRPQSALTPEQRRAIGAVRRNVLMAAMDRELRAQQEKRDPTAARAIISRYRAMSGDDKEIADYLQRRDNQFEMSQLVERVNAAMSAGRTAELDQLFEQILAHPAVTADLRNMVEAARQRKKK